MQDYTHVSGQVPLSSTHPVEQASVTGSAPYWPEAARLEAGASYPIRRASPTVERVPWRSDITQVGLELITGNCLVPLSVPESCNSAGGQLSTYAKGLGE